MRMQFDGVSINKQAQVAANGASVAYELDFPGGCHKTLGVVLAPRASFPPDCAELVEVVAGQCRVRIGAESGSMAYEAGQRFRVPRGAGFEVETPGPLHYVLHRGG